MTPFLLLLFLCSTRSFTVPTIFRRPGVVVQVPLHSTTLEQQTSDSAGGAVDSVAAEEVPEIADEVAAVEEEEVVTDEVATDEVVVATDETADTGDDASESKRKVQRVRHTAFVGNLPYGAYNIFLHAFHTHTLSFQTLPRTLYETSFPNTPR